MKLLLATLLACSVSASAVTVDFEGITPNSAVAVPNGTGGVDWSNFYASNPSNAPDVNGYDFGVISGNSIGLNGFGSPAAFSSSDGFDLVSFYMTAAFRDGLEVTVQGYQHSTLLYSQTLILDADAPTLFTLNFAGLTSAHFTASGGVAKYGNGTIFAMDNLVLAEPSVAIPALPVPEGGPGALGLLMLGGMMLAHRPR